MMNRRSFIKKAAATSFIFTAGLWVPKSGILRPAEGRGLMVVGGGVSAPPPAGIADDFSATLAKWTTDSGGTFAAAGGVLTLDTSQNSTLRYSAAQTDTITQWVKVQLVIGSSVNDHWSGVILRATATDAENKYFAGIALHDVGVGRAWFVVVASSTWVETICNTACTFANGYYFGVMIEGTGSSSTVWYYSWAADPGDGPWAKTGGGLVDTYNFSWASNYCNTGKYVGILGDKNTYQWDNFKAGSYTP